MNYILYSNYCEQMMGGHSGIWWGYVIVVKRGHEMSSAVNKRSGNERFILFSSATWWICFGGSWGDDTKEGTSIVMKT